METTIAIAGMAIGTVTGVATFVVSVVAFVAFVAGLVAATLMAVAIARA